MDAERGNPLERPRLEYDLTAALVAQPQGDGMGQGMGPELVHGAVGVGAHGRGGHALYPAI